MKNISLIVWSFIVFNNVISCLIANNPDDDSLLVNTSLGSLRGVFKKSFSGKTIKVFYKVPFSEPPVGKLRFKPPETVKPWKGTLDCSKMGPACMQKQSTLIKLLPAVNFFLGLGETPPSEDCLYLNVFVPKKFNRKIPVMVWFYGGGFMVGTANSEIYDATTLVAEENVIVVTLNYRVSTFGFLYLGNEGAPGNMGLMDQAMALRWVQSHIKNFGGDPDEVTVFGQSAGSICISHHLNIKSSKGLFKRAILQSGVAHMPNGYESRENLIKSAMEFAKYLECNLDSFNSSIILECLMEKDADDLIDNEPARGIGYNLFFKPVVDGNYITEQPLQAIEKTASSMNMSIIIGNVENEASFFLFGLFVFIFPFKDEIKVSEEDARQTLKTIFGLTANSVIIDSIIGLYQDSTLNGKEINYAKAAEKVASDFLFKCSSLQFEDILLENNNTVYKFRYRHRHLNIPTKNWMGVVHGSELFSVFGTPLDPKQNESEEVKVLSRRVMRYWANFARTGNPNISPNQNEELTIWPEMTMENKNFLILDTHSSQIEYTNERRCQFWTEVLPKIYVLEKQLLPKDNFLIMKLDGNKVIT